jgi:hypothetical protein
MRQMRVSFLLAWRLQRWEVLAVAIAAGSLSIMAVQIAWRFDEVVAACRAAVEVVAPCGGLREAGTIYDNEARANLGLVRQGLAVVPFAAGVILGAPLLAREIEHRTAQLAWPLARSRARWLALRLVPAAIIGLVLVVAPALAGQILARSEFPVISPDANFEGYGERGLLPLARFGLVFVASALVGGWIGRQLPAILVAGVLALGIGTAASVGHGSWVEPVVGDPEIFEPIDSLGDMYVGVRYRLHGNWIGEEEAWERLSAFDLEGDNPNAAELPEQVTYVIYGERYPEVVVRESMALAGAGLGLWGVLLFVVQRRRPG